MGSVLITGGARSGKSRLALGLVSDLSPVVFVATATADDAEMRARIRAHSQERPAGWRTVEEPIDPEGALASEDRRSTIVLDCLTLWTSNLMIAGTPAADIGARAESLADLMSEFDKAVVVTNEVGAGIVPDNPLGRDFRDVLGRVNIAFSDRFDRVLLAVAGRAIEATRP